MIEHYNIRSILKARSAQRSFHVIAERFVRIEFFNLVAGQVLGPFTYDGEVVITCDAGSFGIDYESGTTKLCELDQAIVPVGTRLKLICESSRTVQLIWAPPYAKADIG